MNLIDHLEVPIIQAPIGSASSIDLAVAVSQAGGLGSLAMTWCESEQARQQIEAVRARTEKAFAANFVLSFPCKGLPAALDAGVPVVLFSWGVSAERTRMARSAGSCVGIQVGSVEGAERALGLDVGFLVCQGLEAGGHVQSTSGLAELLPRVVELAGEVPVMAAGGLANGVDVARCLGLGASGAVLGTRFVATHESMAHVDYKQAIVEAVDGDTSFTWCFDGDWPYSGHRVLRNRTLDDWEAAGCPLPGGRPGEGDCVATTIRGWKIPRYHIASPVKTTTGDVLDLALYAGMGSARIECIQSAGEVIERVWAECEAARGAGLQWATQAG